MEKVIELKQQDIDAISDKDVENKICLSCDDYEFSGTMEIKDNTKLIIPLGTTLKITD